MVRLIVISILIALFLGIQMLLSNRSFVRDPQLTSLESGFENLKSNITIRSSFFILAVLYVLFDIELVLLFPIIFIHFVQGIILTKYIFYLIALVSLTLLLEWWWCGLKWQSWCINMP